MKNKKGDLDKIIDEGYEEKLNLLNSDIDNLVHSLSDLLDKEKELLKIEAEKIKKKSPLMDSLYIMGKDEDIQKPKKNKRKYAFIQAVGNIFQNRFKNIKIKKK